MVFLLKKGSSGDSRWVGPPLWYHIATLQAAISNAFFWRVYPSLQVTTREFL